MTDKEDFKMLSEKINKVDKELAEFRGSTTSTLESISENVKDIKNSVTEELPKLKERTNKVEIKSNLAIVLVVLTILFVGSTFFDNITDYIRLIIELMR